MIALAVMPCGDTRDCNEAKANVTAVNDAHHDHEEDTENCSPFCICACCSVQVTVHADQIVLQPLPLKNCEYIVYAASLICDENSTIWQPPKIS
jgi:hypothetical protein